MRCWAEGYCQKRGEHCSECDVVKLLEVVYGRSGIPRRYQYDIPLTPDRRDYAAYVKLREFMEQVEARAQEGRGLYLWGSTGNGKTSWACKVANMYIRKRIFTGDIENMVKFVTVSDYLEALRGQFDQPDGEGEVLGRLASCELLIMDDIGAEKPSEWVAERLYSLLNRRVNEGLPTLFTSNLSLEGLEARLGARTASRIKGACMQVELVGVDRRGMDV